MFIGRLGQQCSDGYIWDAGIQNCVQTYSTDVTDCADPNKVWNELTQTCETPGIAGNGMLYLGIGAAVLLLLSFMGGRASKRSSATGKIRSRTTTRTLFA